MTRFSPIIGYLLSWQLLMPLLCYLIGFSWWIVAINTILYFAILATKNWEKNSYSYISAIFVAIIGTIILVYSICTNRSTPYGLMVMLLYAIIAFTATSPYPLSIRMPVIIYTLCYVFMIPENMSLPIVIILTLLFSTVMIFIITQWRIKSLSLSTTDGPDEPPYSFSLATAIVAAVAINLCLNITESIIVSIVPKLISMAASSLICIWLLCTKDWKKNIFTNIALTLMITLHILSSIQSFEHIHWIGMLIFALSVSPVMFHTTAPVFRGMRIVITLYAVYSALNRQSLIEYLSHTNINECYQHGIIIGVDAILVATLFFMALHWRKQVKA